jgi:hypothetical protein
LPRKVWLWSSGLWTPCDVTGWSNVSEEPVTSIFIFYPNTEEDTFLRNVDNHVQNYTTS